jgi:hypothetical protein
MVVPSEKQRDHEQASGNRDPCTQETIVLTTRGRPMRGPVRFACRILNNPSFGMKRGRLNRHNLAAFTTSDSTPDMPLLGVEDLAAFAPNR